MGRLSGRPFGCWLVPLTWQLTARLRGVRVPQPASCVVSPERAGMPRALTASGAGPFFNSRLEQWCAIRVLPRRVRRQPFSGTYSLALRRETARAFASMAYPTRCPDVVRAPSRGIGGDTTTRRTEQRRLAPPIASDPETGAVFRRRPPQTGRPSSAQRTADAHLPAQQRAALSAGSPNAGGARRIAGR
jgi:hypothetical protein